MKICVTQTRSEKGNIKRNIDNHLGWIEMAVSENVELIAFPELSLTGYEPELARELAMDLNDPGLDKFQQISDLGNITIGVGLPTKSGREILISMVIFGPNQTRRIYSKEKLGANKEGMLIFDNRTGEVIKKEKPTNKGNQSK